MTLENCIGTRIRLAVPGTRINAPRDSKYNSVCPLRHIISTYLYYFIGFSFIYFANRIEEARSLYPSSNDSSKSMIICADARIEDLRGVTRSRFGRNK